MKLKQIEIQVAFIDINDHPGIQHFLILWCTHKEKPLQHGDRSTQVKLIIQNQINHAKTN